MGSRRFDDYDRMTGTGFEGTRTNWAKMDQATFNHKMDQIAADWALMADSDSKVRRVVWFGTHPLPHTGRGGQIRRALEEAGIEYWVVPWR